MNTRGDPVEELLATCKDIGKVCETSGQPRLARVLTVGEDIGHDAIELRL